MLYSVGVAAHDAISGLLSYTEYGSVGHLVLLAACYEAICYSMSGSRTTLYEYSSSTSSV